MRFITVASEDEDKFVNRIPNPSGYLSETYGIIEVEEGDLLTMADLEAANGGGDVVVIEFKGQTANLDDFELQQTHFYRKAGSGYAYDICDFHMDAELLNWEKVVDDEGTDKESIKYNCTDLEKIKELCPLHDIGEIMTSKSGSILKVKVCPDVKAPKQSEVFEGMTSTEINEVLERVKA